ncbi:hypothetical protein, partial [Thiolapillus sp.]|uniref:hypothetical protein n=1 Tax=Thiolapillus sp. TaxID=2017437 RepID=UPI003AF9F454
FWKHEAAELLWEAIESVPDRYDAVVVDEGQDFHADWWDPIESINVKQACLRPRDRFWDIPVPKIDSAFDNLLVPQPSWSPSTTQQLRKLVAAPYLAPI